jgi:hypothetical protein
MRAESHSNERKCAAMTVREKITESFQRRIRRTEAALSLALAAACTSALGDVQDLQEETKCANGSFLP